GIIDAPGRDYAYRIALIVRDSSRWNVFNVRYTAQRTSHAYQRVRPWHPSQSPAFGSAPRIRYVVIKLDEVRSAARQKIHFLQALAFFIFIAPRHDHIRG